MDAGKYISTTPFIFEGTYKKSEVENIIFDSVREFYKKVGHGSMIDMKPVPWKPTKLLVDGNGYRYQTNTNLKLLPGGFSEDAFYRMTSNRQMFPNYSGANEIALSSLPNDFATMVGIKGKAKDKCDAFRPEFMVTMWDQRELEELIDYTPLADPERKYVINFINNLELSKDFDKYNSVTGNWMKIDDFGMELFSYVRQKLEDYKRISEKRTSIALSKLITDVKG